MELSDNDFYNIDRKWLASYFEMDWSDKVIEQSSDANLGYRFSKFDPRHLYSDYHEKLIQFSSAKLNEAGIVPSELLEVELSSLGRTFYEVCKSLPSIKSATLIEPSQNFMNSFHCIFHGDKAQLFPTLCGYTDFIEVLFDSSEVKKSCANVQITTLNKPFQELEKGALKSDLVICSNVIDQCHQPLDLIEFLKSSTRPGGVLVVSCTYQWNEKYVDRSKGMIENINHLFGSEWKHLGETDLDFKVRRNERWWTTFLSHVSIFQKNSES